MESLLRKQGWEDWDTDVARRPDAGALCYKHPGGAKPEIVLWHGSVEWQSIECDGSVVCKGGDAEGHVVGALAQLVHGGPSKQKTTKAMAGLILLGLHFTKKPSAKASWGNKGRQQKLPGPLSLLRLATADEYWQLLHGNKIIASDRDTPSVVGQNLAAWITGAVDESSGIST